VEGGRGVTIWLHNPPGAAYEAVVEGGGGEVTICLQKGHTSNAMD
jgi:hypothetical protein